MIGPGLDEPLLESARRRAASGAPRVGLLGMYTSRNLGDTAIVAEIMRNLRARLGDCTFVAINRDPEDAVRTFGIDAFPSEGYGPALLADGAPWHRMDRPGPHWLQRGLGTRRIVAAVRTLDLLVMAGGGQIEDFFGGRGSQPRVLLTWTALARLFGVPVAFFAVGVDQVLDPVSRRRAVNAMRLAQFRSVRDAGSRDLMRAAGLRSTCRVDPDPALGLATAPAAAAEDVVVISPIAFRTFERERQPTYDGYLDALAGCCDQALAEGHRIRFVCSDISMDPPVVSEVLARMQQPQAETEFVDVRTVGGFVGAVADTRLIVASRLHGLVLGAAAGVPLLAVSPARKVDRFMQDAGLGAWCMPLAGVSAATLGARMNRALAEEAELRRQTTRFTERCRADLAGAYDALAGVLPPS